MKPDRTLRSLKAWQGKGSEGVLRLLKKTKGKGKNTGKPRLSKENVSRLMRLQG